MSPQSKAYDPATHEHAPPWRSVETDMEQVFAGLPAVGAEPTPAFGPRALSHRPAQSSAMPIIAAAIVAGLVGVGAGVFASGWLPASQSQLALQAPPHSAPKPAPEAAPLVAAQPAPAAQAQPTAPPLSTRAKPRMFARHWMRERHSQTSVLDADRRLRLAYARAETAGASPQLISFYRQRWWWIRDHERDRPAKLVADYLALARDLDHARARRPVHLSQPRRRLRSERPWYLSWWES